jgi:hypothetical protein
MNRPKVFIGSLLAAGTCLWGVAFAASSGAHTYTVLPVGRICEDFGQTVGMTCDVDTGWCNDDGGANTTCGQRCNVGHDINGNPYWTFSCTDNT